MMQTMAEKHEVVEFQKTQELCAIHCTRDELRARRLQLENQRALWEKEMEHLVQSEARLYADCMHSRQVRDRTMCAYDETEYHCPDCGRVHVVG